METIFPLQNSTQIERFPLTNLVVENSKMPILRPKMEVPSEISIKPKELKID